MIATKKPLFDLGQVVATPGALAALEDAGQSPAEFLGRHVHGDWGTVDEHDQKANADAVRHGDRILSAYVLRTNVRIWAVTEADRSSTCLLLPEEY